jgi:tetratricopeptide (TPR) repeat protein
MTDVIAESLAAAPPEPPPGFEPCACGSGLRAAKCCKLNLARTPRTPPEGLYAERVARMSRAYNDGERKLAEHLALEILDEAPGQRDALGALYNVCKDERRFDAAAALVRRMAALYANDALCQLTAAQYFLSQDDAGHAQPFARMLVRLAPEAIAAHVTMGRVFIATNHHKDAEHHFRRAAELAGRPDPDIEIGLAGSLRGQGRFAEAREIFARLLETGEQLHVLLAAASLEEADRQFDAASALLDRAQTIAPGGPRVVHGRAMLLRRAKRYEEALQTLDHVDEQFRGSGLHVAALIEKGHILDALGRYDEAFETYVGFKRKALERGGQTYAEGHARNLTDRLKEFFTEGRSQLMPRAEVRPDTPQPIFVVGFMRSGTTLVEQTLASHPSISAGDELHIIISMAERMQALLGSPGAYPAALSELWLGDRVGQINTIT